MDRYRLRIVLLSLGVILGYGSAAAHFARWHAWHDHRYEHAPCHHDWFGSDADLPQERGHDNQPKPLH
jgi:hypothetical protein